MSNIKKRSIILTALLIVVCITLVWYMMKWNDTENLEIVDAANKTTELSAWVVDWQWESGLEDFRRMTDGLSSVQVFAAYFDENDKLHFTDRMTKAMPEIKEASKQGSYVDLDLTIVNDRLNRDGTQIQKDPSIVSRLMATEDSRTKHIMEIKNAVIQNGFHGLEIDYERIDEKDWDNFLTFIHTLYQQMEQEEKSLRIVLEPRAPIEELALPKGPTYVMMAYNLYGMNTEPGPKADHAFIEELAQRMQKVPSDKIMALSVGGFDWASDGKVTAVTEKQAADFAISSIEPPKRDKASGSLYFDYMGEDGQKHTVWYADEETLSQWVAVAKKAGIEKIALWRLGDMGEGTLQYVNR
ncbi:glycosyl hydrolase [Brevibacillus brevis]|uniref:Glycosyl hydrolase n=1 Tax=Brevibacillus brevis TaxID=1393 RepID=A0A2Z4MQT7_BREBE|nr:glycosyl hydrolase family 18 protein [Brevibacillus brevis]AWX58927.1 glycosyl hydrolase [Brevibacillus brevis]